MRLSLSLSLLWCLPLTLCTAGPALSAEGTRAWLGVSTLDFDFKEFDDGGTRLNHEHGSLPGFAGGIELSWAAVFAEAGLSYYSGDVRHDGQTQSGLPVTTRTDEDILDGSALAGVQFAFKRGFGSAAFVGAGYRHWKRDIRSTRSATGLFETYDWWYGLLGVKIRYAMGERMSWTVNLRVTRPVNPSIEIKFRNALDDETLKLGEKTGYRLGLVWRYAFTDRVGLRISPFFEQWKLGRSSTQSLTQNGTVVGMLHEPRSETRNRGLTLGLDYNL